VVSRELYSIAFTDASFTDHNPLTWLSTQKAETPLRLNDRIVIAATIYIYESWKGNSVSSVSNIKSSNTKCTSEVSD